MLRLTWLVVLCVASMLLAAPARATVDDGPCSGTASGDYNGDGIADLASGGGDEDLPAGDAGGVNVIYGSGSGLTATAAGIPAPGNQFWTQDSTDIEGGSEAGDRFGGCLAAGDFDGNGQDDIAIAATGEDVGTLTNVGSVNVIYGSAAGLSASSVRADQIWHQDSTDIEGVAESGDKFGGALAAGDFNADGRDDLAIGVPLEDIGALADAGAVNVIYGSANGLRAAGDQVWFQDSSTIEGASEADDRYGSSLATGDLNSGPAGPDDLAIGVPGEDGGSSNQLANSGAVNVMYGATSGGLGVAGDQAWTQDSRGVLGKAETDDNLGKAVAIGDFQGDAIDDLAMGAPNEDVGARGNAGTVNVLLGTASRLKAAGDLLFSQNDTTFTGDTSEAGDKFGAALAAADYDGSGQDDLAIGVPFEDTAVTDVGAVEVVYGSGSGLVLTSNVDFWTQGSGGVPDAAEQTDNFGSALTQGNFNGGASPADLAIGVPMEDIVATLNSGAVAVIYGIAVNGLDTAGPPAAQFWHQDVTDILDIVEIGDMFGSALS